MNWKNLRNNPPLEDCELLCKEGKYKYFARWWGGRTQTYCPMNNYGELMRGRTRSINDAPRDLMYINLDEIKNG